MLPDLPVPMSRRPKTAIPRQPYVNFGYGRLATAPTPPLTGTMFMLQPGHATRFPAPPFSASIWPYAEPPDPSTAEVVTVYTVEGDTFTVERAQEQTTPRAILAGDQISANVTAGNMNAIGFWQNVDVHDAAFYALTDPQGSLLQVGQWTPPTDPVSSYAWAAIGVGTIAVAFHLVGTTITTPLAGAVFALKLPTTPQLGQAWGREASLGNGTVAVMVNKNKPAVITFAYVISADAWIRFGGNLNLAPGSYDMAGSLVLPCDWW